MSMFDIYPNDLISKVAEELKKVDSIKPPVWSLFVKTGVSRERPPTDKDWWYVRAAAILRAVAVLGPIGVSKLRTKYGSKKRNGHKPAHFRKSSGSIIRKILQQLEKAGLIKFVEKDIHKGRVITGKGKSILDKAAIAVKKSNPVPRFVVNKEERIHVEKPHAEKVHAEKPIAEKTHSEKVHAVPKPVHAENAKSAEIEVPKPVHVEAKEAQ